MLNRVSATLSNGYVIVRENGIEVLQMPGESVIVAYFSDGRFEICDNYFSLETKSCVDECNGMKQN